MVQNYCLLSKIEQMMRLNFYMILVSKNFLGALRLNLDPKIQDPRILRSEDLENWISGSGSIRRALKKIILTKTTYGLQLLLLTNFYLTLGQF